MHPSRWWLPFLALALVMATGHGMAQSRTRVWDVEFGTPVDRLPLKEFVEPACGTDGGPPALPLESFLSFALCPVEPATGLREVWFIYDDEWEYIARAQRDVLGIGRYSANTLDRQPILTSLLIDGGGLVQGYRVITDPRAPIELRASSHLLGGLLRTLVTGANWACADLPRDERERPIDGEFVKQSCQAAAGVRLAKVETRHFYKAGQDVRDVPRFLDAAAGDFESSARLEVYAAAAVRDAPCCRASVRQ